MLQSRVPEGVKVLDLVWAMKRKRRIKTKEIYKWKARLNIHGGQQEYGVNYWETFAPVVIWISIRLILILSILLCWHTRQIDFILAYPQAPLKTPLFMEIPKGVTMHKMPRKAQDYVLELKKHLYGQKQAGCWTDELQTRRRATSEWIVEKTKDVGREDLWRFVMSSDLISLSIDNRLY
jgi:Reverse transcriptase (RNA-dependent DNA polymerase)